MMMKVVLLGLLLGMQIHGSAFAEPLKGEMLLTRLYSAVQMRSLQTKLEALCKLTQKDCFVNAAMVDAVPAQKSAVEISAWVSEAQVFGTAHAEKSDATSAMKTVIKQSGIHKSADALRMTKDALNEINQLSKNSDIEIVSSILYSPVTNERMMTVVLKNKKFNSAEVITFGAGDSADTI